VPIGGEIVIAYPYRLYPPREYFDGFDVELKTMLPTRNRAIRVATTSE